MATSTIKPKRGTTAQWAASSRVLEENEWGVEVTPNGHHILRIGDGEHFFHELPAVFDAENYEALMAQAVNATNAANTAAANADAAAANADAATAAALAAADTAITAAQANTNAIIKDSSGDIVNVNDSSNLALVGLKLYGKTTQDGTPTPDAPVPLVSAGEAGVIHTWVTGKNLLPFPYDGDDGTINGVTIHTNDVAQTVIFSGTASETFSWILATTTLPQGEYFASDGLPENENNGLELVVYDVNNQEQIATRNKKFTIEKRKSVQIYYLLQKGYDVSKICRPMLSYGEIAEHEIYNVQSLTAQTPNGLPGIPVTSDGNYTDANGQQWICDEVDFARGVYVRRVGNYEFDGSEDENWKVIASAGEGKFRITTPEYFKAKTARPIMTNFGYIGKLAGDAGLSGHADGVWSYYNSAQAPEATMTVYIAISKYPSLDDLKAGLAENPFRVISHLATPIETPLSAEEIAAFKLLHSNKPNTTVYNDSGAGMSVEYIADTKTYIDNKFTELQNAILSAGANV